MVPQSISTLWGSNGERARRVRWKPCMSGSQRNSPASRACPDCVVGDAGGHGESRATPRGLGGHTIQAEQPPLKVVYWNVAGVRAADIDTFLEHIDVDLRWDVLVLLEFFACEARDIPLGHSSSSAPGISPTVATTQAGRCTDF